MGIGDYGIARLLLVAGLTMGCQGCAPPPPPPVADYQAFANPQAVTITGYTGDAMEPFISPDGQFLFFNNSNAPTNDTNLFYATRMDDLTFQLGGQVGGANTTSLDAVASMDRDGTFYFVSTRNYAQTMQSIYSGHFVAGNLSGVAPVAGVSKQQGGMLNFDAGISADGTTLYFVDGQFNGGAAPQAADLVVASRAGTAFQRLPNSADLLSNVNTDALEYAPCISQSGLELFFTRFSNNTTAIYRSVRTSLTGQFALPERVSAAAGMNVEAPTLSPDELSLYYHQQVSGVFSIYRITRSP